MSDVIRDIQLKRTEKTINSLSSNVKLNYGEVLVSPKNHYLIVGKKATTTQPASSGEVFLALGVPKPSLQQTVFQSTGSTIKPYIVNYYPDFCTASGTQQSSSIGNYQITFTLKDGFKWYDGSSNNVILDWSIVQNLPQKVTNSVDSDNANKLKVARNINGLSFDGTSDVLNYYSNTSSISTNPREITVSKLNNPLVEGTTLKVRLANGYSGNNALQITVKNSNSTIGTYSVYDRNGQSITSVLAGEVLDLVYAKVSNQGRFISQIPPKASSSISGTVTVSSDRSSNSDSVAASTKLVAEKNRIFVQSDTPTNARVGDLWINNEGVMKYCSTAPSTFSNIKPVWP